MFWNSRVNFLSIVDILFMISIDVTRVTSPANQGIYLRATGSFVQSFALANNKEIIKIPHFWPFMLITHGFQAQRVSNVEIVSMSWYYHTLWPLHLFKLLSLQWHHNGHDSISNHQPHDCLLNRLFKRRSKKTSKLRVTGCCAGNSPGTVEFPAQMASHAENVSIWWHHHVYKSQHTSKMSTNMRYHIYQYKSLFLLHLSDYCYNLWRFKIPVLLSIILATNCVYILAW